jgi:hypothetical protein
MKLKLFGPGQLFTCDFEITEDDEFPVVQSVANLRVLALNRRDKSPEHPVLWFERPLLLRAQGRATKIKLAGKSAKVSTEVNHVLAAPVSLDDADWLQSPPTADLYLQQARIEIWISRDDDVGKLLQLAGDQSTGYRMLGSLPCVLEGGRLRAFLTNRGIEFAASVPTPGPQEGATQATLLLTWSPASSGKYQIELVSTGENQDIQHSLTATFRQLQGERPEDRSPLELDFNATLPVPPLSWPLAIRDGKMELEGALAGQSLGTWKAWRARLSGDAVRCRMATAKGALLAEIRPDVLNLEKTEKVLQAEAQIGNPSANALAEWNQESGQWSDKFLGAGLPEEVFIDAESIHSRVMPLYRAAGVYPQTDTEPTYAFFFVDRGWLQCTLPAAKNAVGATNTQVVKHPQVLTGEIQINLPDARSLRLEGASALAVKATWSLGANGVPFKVTLRVDEPEGNYAGFLFYAESSPTELDALPALQGGAIITRDAPFRFGVNAPRPSRLWAGKLTNHILLDLHVPKGSFLWRRDARMPLIPNMPLTNGPAASGVPSSSRGLLPYEIPATDETVKIQMNFNGVKLPLVTAPLAWPAELVWPAKTAALQLTVPSLPGVTIIPDKPETTLQAALRFDLPILDEMFATASIPPEKGAAAVAAVGLIPTAVLPELLKAEVWEPNARKLKLAMVDRAQATDIFVPVDTSQIVKIQNLVEPGTWKTSFGVSSQPPLGSYQLNGVSYSAENAAKGVNDTQFTLTDSTLTAGAGPIEARNLAVHLFPRDGGFVQDSRGFVVAKAANSGESNITYRSVCLRGDLTAKRRLATAKTPRQVRDLWFWFRDLPFPQDSWRFNGDENPLESPKNPAESPAFDPDKIAASLHEWRLYEDPPEGDPPAFRIKVGAFWFWPLRLRELKLDDMGDPTLLKVLGRLDLQEAVNWDLDRPFGPDLSSRPGNLVEWEIVKNEWTPYPDAAQPLFHFAKVLKCKPDTEDQIVQPSTIAVTLSYELDGGLSMTRPLAWTLEFLFAGTSLKMVGSLAEGNLLFQTTITAHNWLAIVDLAAQTLSIVPNFVLKTSGKDQSTVLELNSEGLKWLGLPPQETKTRWSLDLVTGRFWLNVPGYEVAGEVLPGIALTRCQVNGSVQWLIAPGTGGRWEMPAIYGEFRSVPLDGSETNIRIVHTIHSDVKGVEHDVRLTGVLSRTSQIEWPTGVFAKQTGKTMLVTIQKEDYTWIHDFAVELQDHRYPVTQLKAGALTGEWRFDAVVRHSLKRSTDPKPRFEWRSLDQLRMLTGATWIQEGTDFSLIQSFIGLPKEAFFYRGYKILDDMADTQSLRADLASSGFRDHWLQPHLTTFSTEVFLLGGSLTVFQTEQGSRPLLWAYFADRANSIVVEQRDRKEPTEWRASAGDLPPLLNIQHQDAPFQVLPRDASEDEIKNVLEPKPEDGDKSANLVPEWVQQVFFESLQTNVQSARRDDKSPPLKTIPWPPLKTIPFFLGSLLALDELRKLDLQFEPQWSLRVNRDKPAVCVRIKVPDQDEIQSTPHAEAPRLIVLSRKEGVKSSFDISNADADNPTQARITSVARATLAQPLAVFIRSGGSHPTLTKIDVQSPFLDNHAAPPPPPNPIPLLVAPSPALGWPAEEGATHAALMVPTVGNERVSVSEQVGIAARSAVTAWPAYGPTAGTGYGEAIYYNSHAAVVFQPAPYDPPLNSRAPRHFSPVPNRVRAPHTSEVNTALQTLTGSKDKLKYVLPISVANLERGVTGLRPGAFHVFATSVTIPGRATSFDPLWTRFGRPASRGPVLAHQLRAPRGTRLPIDADLSWRRRTFLSEANLNHLFGRFPGPAAVWRFDRSEERWHFILSLDPESPAVTPTWGGALRLKIDSACNKMGDLDSALRDCHFKSAAAVLHIGTQTFPFRPLDVRLAEKKVYLQLDLLTGLTEALLAVTGNTPVYLEFQLPGASSDKPLQPGPPDFLRLPIQLAPLDRPVLSLRTTTIAFGDPSYDRQLASPAQLATRFNPQGNYVLSLDRRQYERNGSVFFAFGKIAENGTFATDSPGGTISFQRVRVEVASAEPQDLTLEQSTSVQVAAAQPYSFSLTTVRFNGQPVAWASGDQLLVTVKITEALVLTAAVKIVDEPQIAPPPSVYSLIRAKETSADVALHASGPMPQRIEFPDILRDLALGHVRRRALFVWHWTTTDDEGKLLLIKVDRSGGTQIPDPQ